MKKKESIFSIIDSGKGFVENLHKERRLTSGPFLKIAFLFSVFSWIFLSISIFFLFKAQPYQDNFFSRSFGMTGRTTWDYFYIQKSFIFNIFTFFTSVLSIIIRKIHCKRKSDKQSVFVLIIFVSSILILIVSGILLYL